MLDDVDVLQKVAEKVVFVFFVALETGLRVEIHILKISAEVSHHTKVIHTFHAVVAIVSVGIIAFSIFVSIAAIRVKVAALLGCRA